MIGVVLNLLYDGIIKHLKDNSKKAPEFNDVDKLKSIIIWPIGFIVFLIHFLKALFRR